MRVEEISALESCSEVDILCLVSMVSRFELNHRYDEYLEIISQANIISRGGEDVDFPTQMSIQDDSFDVDMRGEVEGAVDLLLSTDGSRGDIRYLSPDLYNWLAVKLTDVLRAKPTPDHYEYWWFTHDFIRAFSDDIELFPEELIDNLELLIRLVCYPLGSNEHLSPEARKIFFQLSTLASYLAYPTLEGFTKIALRHDVKMDGEIRRGRRVRKLTSSERVFQHWDGDNSICSNLGSLLWHFETEVASPKNSVLMKKMRENAGEILDQRPDRIYGYINDVRNDSLHGQNQPSKERGVFLNYICLIIWNTLN